MTFSQSSEPFSVQLGDKLPQREFKPDNVQLFLYNAILWNAHRIHFDETYTTEVEGYPGLVIAGPMIGDWLHQCVEDWLGEEGRLVSMEYSNRIAAYIGETLHYGGNVIALDSDSQEARVEVFIKNEAGKIVAPGEATVLFANKE